MIEETLKKLGTVKMYENHLTEKINQSTHYDCHKDFWDVSQLDKYFMASKERGPCYSYLRYCEDEDVEMCQKCEVVLNLIRERKRVRRKLSALHGAVTKYALSLVGDINIYNQKEDV